MSLFTVKNVGTDNGAHSGLLINGSQRVMFDPAGSFAHPAIPERNDVIFGMTPQLLELYRSYHARETFYVVEQALPVAPEIAERAMQLAFVAGPVGKARCTFSISELLTKLPGFAPIRTTFFPDNLETQFAKLPGVETSEYRENDADDKTEALATFDEELGVAPTGG